MLSNLFFVQKVTFLLSKIHETVATRAAVLARMCTKSFVGWGFAPDPLGKLKVLRKTSSCI